MSNINIMGSKVRSIETKIEKQGVAEDMAGRDSFKFHELVARFEDEYVGVDLEGAILITMAKSKEIPGATACSMGAMAKGRVSNNGNETLFMLLNAMHSVIGSTPPERKKEMISSVVTSVMNICKKELEGETA